MRLAPVLSILLLACSPSEVLDSFRGEPSTAHGRYAGALRDAGLDSTALGLEWLAASDSALADPFEAELPLREVGVYTRDEARAVAWRLELREGQRLEVSLGTEGLPARLFLDLFEATGDTARPFRHRATADSADGAFTLGYEVRRDGRYLLRFQPELLRAGRYELVARLSPILAFPVEGGTNRSIMSYFGAARDGGSRSHHGIDIFAPRGTPVIAATAGEVRSTRPNALGGNVVWLRDDVRQQSLYYAHLDTVLAQRGQRVAMGDTLGLVGNSGNARTTAPHLHFGIYRRDRGPVDPLPWVRLVDAATPGIRVDTAMLGRRGETRIADLPLRVSSASDGATAHVVPAAAAVRIMAAAGSRYRVQLDDGRAGYLAPSAVRLTEQ